MRTNLLIDKNGIILNPSQANLINYSSINGESSSTLFFNQITVEFYNAIKTLDNGLKVPDNATVVRSGLSGTIQVQVWASENSPYVVPLSENSINIASACMLQWTGISQKLSITCTGITGANYINVLLDRS